MEKLIAFCKAGIPVLAFLILAVVTIHLWLGFFDWLGLDVNHYSWELINIGNDVP